MSCRHKSKSEDKLQVRKLVAKDACIKNLKNKNLESQVANIETASINNAGINNLDISNISVNGKDVTCRLSQIAVATQNRQITLFADTGPVPDNINPTVYNCLMKNAIDYGNDLQCRLCTGRTLIANYLATRGCPTPCPAPVGATGTECSGYTGCEPKNTVPLSIYGVLTLPIYRETFCGGVTGSTGVSQDVLNTAVNFNLQVTYLLDVANSIDARNVSVLIQVGYVDPLGPTGGEFSCTGVTGGENVVISEVFVANKQFYPTLDTLYGENFANTISIPNQLLQTAYLNSFPNSQGAIQMVIYKEEGLCIWTPKGSDAECLGSDNFKCTNCSAQTDEQLATGRCPGKKICINSIEVGSCVDCAQPCPSNTIREITINCPKIQITKAVSYTDDAGFRRREYSFDGPQVIPSTVNINVTGFTGDDSYFNVSNISPGSAGESTCGWQYVLGIGGSLVAIAGACPEIPEGRRVVDNPPNALISIAGF